MTGLMRHKWHRSANKQYRFQLLTTLDMRAAILDSRGWSGSGSYELELVNTTSDHVTSHLRRLSPGSEAFGYDLPVTSHFIWMAR